VDARYGNVLMMPDLPDNAQRSSDEFAVSFVREEFDDERDRVEVVELE
jgi:hypothetical protein